MTPSTTPALASRQTSSTTGHWLRVKALLSGGTDRVAQRRDAIAAFLVRLTSAALLYVSQIAMARWMGSTEYSVYVFVWTCVLMSGAIAHLGLSLGIIRLIPVHREAARHDLVRGLVNGGRAFAVVAGTLFALVGLSGLWLFQHHVSSHYALAAYFALVCIPLYAMTDVQDGIGRGSGWMAAALVPPYILRPILLLACMTAANAAGLSMVAATAMAAAIIATWATGLIQALWINRQMAATFGSGPQAYAPRAWAAASLPLLAISGSEILLQNTDILVLSRYLTPTDVAIYFAAGKTMSLIMFVHYAVGSAMAPRFSSYKARGDDEGLRMAVRDAVNWTFWPSLAVALIILAAAKPLLSLFGPQFVAGYPVMTILVLGFLVRAAMGPAEYLLNMQGQQRLCALVMLTAAGLNIMLNLILVPSYGMKGAATATALSLAIAALANAAVAYRRLGLHVAIWSNVRRG